MRHCSRCKEEITPENEDIKMTENGPVSNGRRCIRCRRAYQVEYYHRTKEAKQYEEPSLELYIEKYGETVGRPLWAKYEAVTKRIQRIELIAKENGLNVNNEEDTEKILRIEHG